MRGRADLSFFPSYLDTDIPIPPELSNEPFTFEDDGYRVDIIKRRVLFKFQVQDVMGRANCLIGRKQIVGPEPEYEVSPDQLPEKSTSDVSVLTVYDGYGLEVAYSYLRYLYQTSQYYADWILVYLAGSLYAIDDSIRVDLDDQSRYHILYLCSLIFRALENMDRKEPKMLGKLENVPEGTLPDDIMSRIIGSRRVSRAVRADVQDAMCNEALELRELMNANRDRRNTRGVTVRFQDGTCALISSDKKEWRLSRDGRRFILEYNEGVDDVDDYLRTPIVNYPFETYALAYRKRGCEPRSSMVSLLRQIRATQVSEERVLGMMRWLVQLSYELGLNKQDAVFQDLYELGEELDSLLELAIAEYSTPETRR